MCGCLSMCPQPGTWPTTQACALTGNGTSKPSVPKPAVNSLSHTSQGSICFYIGALIKVSPLYYATVKSLWHECSKIKHTGSLEESIFETFRLWELCKKFSGTEEYGLCRSWQGAPDACQLPSILCPHGAAPKASIMTSRTRRRLSFSHSFNRQTCF